MATKTTKQPQDLLPLGLTEQDLKYPSGDKDRVAWRVGNSGSIELYYTSRFGWCVATLQIGSGRRAERTYGVTVKGQVVTMGAGPHVLRKVTAWVRETRVAALQALIDLHTKGMTDAGNIRDRVSSRRAQGQLMRSEGRTSWRWDQ